MEGLNRALTARGWQLLTAKKLEGGYAADLFRVRVRDEQGRICKAVYKRFAPGRAQELRLYERIVPQLPHGVPQLYMTVEEQDEQGMLIEAAGDAMKPGFCKADRAVQRQALQEVVTLLADLHAGMAEQARTWLAAGLTDEYPFHSSLQWGEEAVRALRGQVDDNTLAEVQGIVDAFYPCYPELAAGRTTFTHGDPHMENILIHGDRIRFIDWEWACLAVPQRDVAILFQDVLDDTLHEEALAVYQAELNKRGWHEDPVLFRSAYTASLLDNTLMMLGWEIGKHRNGYLTDGELSDILEIKLRWIRRCAQELNLIFT